MFYIYFAVHLGHPFRNLRKFLYLYPTLAVILKQMRNIEEIEGAWRSCEEFGEKFVSRILNRDRGLKSPLVTKKVKNVIF